MKAKIRAVFDTNILVSATFWEGNEAKLVEAVENSKIELCLSPQILNEFIEVISRPKFGLVSSEVVASTEHIATIANFVVPTQRINQIIDDPDDNKILEAAVECKAQYIVSGDDHLLKLKNFEGIEIVKSGKLLDLLKDKE